MQQIVRFFINKKDFFVFLLLFTISIGLTFRNNYYQQSLYLNSANTITGGVFRLSHSFHQYLNLKKQNELLSEENRRLHNENFNLKNFIAQNTIPPQDSFFYDEDSFSVQRANVIKNSYSLKKNYITIDKGKQNQITQDMGVISPKGAVGIVESVSERFAIVQSLLNVKSSINAQVKKSGHFGSLKWNGEKLNMVQLVDIPTITPIEVGDTITTGGMSQIFPKGVPIGKIQSFEHSLKDNTYVINVELFNDMSNLNQVYLISNNNKTEINALESQLQ